MDRIYISKLIALNMIKQCEFNKNSHIASMNCDKCTKFVDRGRVNKSKNRQHGETWIKCSYLNSKILRKEKLEKLTPKYFDYGHSKIY
jgi:hypothetical protein